MGRAQGLGWGWWGRCGVGTLSGSVGQCGQNIALLQSNCLFIDVTSTVGENVGFELEALEEVQGKRLLLLTVE
jgi:hypothetical protein